MQTENLIPNNLKRIGVMLSGGIDSALLLYLMAKENKEKGNLVEITAFTIHRHDGAEHFSNQIINTVEKMLDVTIPKIAVGQPTAHSNKQVQTGIFEATLKHRAERVYLASTAVPEHLNIPDFAPNRDPNNYKSVFQPWVLILKDQVIKYIVENNLDELAKASHSCTSQSYGRCNKCFNCLERTWAFEVNNANDCGID
jgi:tRNA(Ile)-lysidine synthase TilS/MesJ